MRKIAMLLLCGLVGVKVAAGAMLCEETSFLAVVHYQSEKPVLVGAILYEQLGLWFVSPADRMEILSLLRFDKELEQMHFQKSTSFKMAVQKCSGKVAVYDTKLGDRFFGWRLVGVLQQRQPSGPDRALPMPRTLIEPRLPANPVEKTEDSQKKKIWGTILEALIHTGVSYGLGKVIP